MPSESSQSKSRPSLMKVLGIMSVVLIGIGLAVAAGYFYWKYNSLRAQDPKIEQEKVLSAVSKIMVLPDETPTVATVTEKEKLSEQSFFKNAENGDKVLLFLDAQKAILYRPSLRKIIDVAPIKTEDKAAPSPTPKAESNATPDPSIPKKRVVIYNGTTISGFSQGLANSLAQTNPIFEVINRANAANTNYEKTLVVDLTGKSAADAATLAGLVEGSVQALPEGETRPNADLLIILGAEYQQR